MLRRSRQIVRKAVIDPFVDIELLENYSTRIDTIGVMILHKAIGDFKKNYTSFEPNLHNNSILREAVHIVKTRNDTRYLENYILGFLLMSVKVGIRQYRDRAVDTLL